MADKRQRDLTNEAQIVQDVVHANIHRGVAHTSGHGVEGVADDGTLIVLIQTADLQPAHLRYSMAGGGDHRVEFFEGTTFSDEGTLCTCVNRNRVMDLPCQATVTHTPTLTDDGLSLVLGIQPGGSSPGQNTPGSASKNLSEWVLKPNETYMLRITNLAGSAQPLSAQVDFYEPNHD